MILRDSAGDGGEDIVKELRDHVATEIGKIARPRQVMVVPELPKTRSGKIMRRLLRDVAEKREVGDVTTLADSTVMNLISDNLKAGSKDDDDGRATDRWTSLADDGAVLLGQQHGADVRQGWAAPVGFATKEAP